jgi:hypothetical protein
MIKLSNTIIDFLNPPNSRRLHMRGTSFACSQKTPEINKLWDEKSVPWCGHNTFLFKLVLRTSASVSPSSPSDKSRLQLRLSFNDSVKQQNWSFFLPLTKKEMEEGMEIESNRPNAEEDERESLCLTVSDSLSIFLWLAFFVSWVESTFHGMVIRYDKTRYKEKDM